MLEKKEYFNIEAEAAVLGTIILNNQYLRRVEDILQEKHFYEAAHKNIFNKIVNSLKNDGLANTVTLKQFFESDEEVKFCGGASYISDLLAAASTIIDIRKYAFLIVENYNKRQSQEFLIQSLQRLEKEDTLAVVDELSNNLAKLDNESSQVVIRSGEDMRDKLLLHWQNKDAQEPIPSGIPTLDKMLNGGFCKKKLYVIAAAPGCGKTSFSQQVILKALEKQMGCFFFSIEMEEESILTRFLGYLSEVNPFRILINNIFNHEKQRFEIAGEKFAELQKYFLMTDDSNICIQKIKSVLKRAKRKIPISLVVVDYIQIMQLKEAKNVSEATLIKENVTALKEIAKTFDVAVIALSQLTKESLDGKPSLKALKGSGGIGEGADTVINIWNDDKDDGTNQAQTTINFSIAKNRNGAKGDILIKFDGEFGKFTEKSIINNF